MKAAIRQAKKAYALLEVPIGCVIVHEGKIIGRGYNRRNTDKNTLAHAEITAINRASKKLGDWRLDRTHNNRRSLIAPPDFFCIRYTPYGCWFFSLSFLAFFTLYIS